MDIFHNEREKQAFEIGWELAAKVIAEFNYKLIFVLHFDLEEGDWFDKISMG